MRALVQRVKSAFVEVDDVTVGRIGHGLLLFLGVGSMDSRRDAEYLADKVSRLRLFGDTEGRMSLSVQDVRGALLVVSQFTLYGECRKGRRPNFSKAAPPDVAEELYRVFIERLFGHGLHVEEGRFGAMMEVTLTNDGPVTLLLESEMTV